MLLRKLYKTIFFVILWSEYSSITASQAPAKIVGYVNHYPVLQCPRGVQGYVNLQGLRIHNPEDVEIILNTDPYLNTLPFGIAVTIARHKYFLDNDGTWRSLN